MKKINYLKLLLVMLTMFASQLANAQCVASFSYASNPNGVVTFTNTSTGNYTTAQWSFGDGTGGWGSNTTHTYNSLGVFTVCLTIYDSLGPCQSTSCDTVVVGSSTGPCSSNFTVTPVGGTTSFQFYNASTGNFTSTSWDFGDSTFSSLANPQHTYSQPGTYTACLTVANALAQCYSISCYIVTVTSGGTTCDAQFGYQNVGTSYSFYSANTQGLIYNWSFGDGGNSSSANPTHQYLVAGNYVVCLTVTDSAQTCSDTYCDTVSINGSGNCQANFSYTTVNPVGGNFVQFTDLSTGSASSWYWDFGDSTSSTLQNPGHLYAANGTYYVCLTISTFLGCTSTYCSYLTIGNSTGCQAYFSASPDTSNGVQFNNGSTGGFVGQYWSFGDGSNSSQSNPFHQYSNPGTYLVCLSLYMNGAICDSYCDSIVVGNPANACVPVFYSYPDSSVFGNGVVYFGLFNNCPGTQYAWNFGDSTVGFGLNPTHQYADSGWFEVCVIAYSPAGTFIFCDSVYANRMGSFSGLNENANSYSLNIYPNPLSGLGTMELILKSTSHVKADVYSVEGKLISTIVDASLQSGTSKIATDVSKLKNGIYLVRLAINDAVVYQKISVLK